MRISDWSSDVCSSDLHATARLRPRASRASLTPLPRKAISEDVMSEHRIDPNGPLKGRNALVTGASRGHGDAIATRQAMEGVHVVVSARTAESAESRDRERAVSGTGGAVRVDPWGRRQLQKKNK